MFRDDVNTTVRDRIEGKVKDSTVPRKRQVRREFIYGSDPRNSKGDFVDKVREIDRDADTYRETIKDEKTGEVLRNVEEKLSEHFGRGSAKTKTSKSGDGTAI